MHLLLKWITDGSLCRFTQKCTPLWPAQSFSFFLHLFPSSLTVIPQLPFFFFLLCLLSDVKLARTAPFQFSSTFPGALFYPLTNSMYGRFWRKKSASNTWMCSHVQYWCTRARSSPWPPFFPFPLSSPTHSTSSKIQFFTLSWTVAESFH